VAVWWALSARMEVRWSLHGSEVGPRCSCGSDVGPR
jgi:hypothetical protein